MFCESCGSKLKDSAKFCGNCGGRVSTVSNSGVLPSIKLAALPPGLSDCEIKIHNASAIGPDSDGDLGSIEVNYEITNHTGGEFNHLAIRVQLLSANGHILGDTIDLVEQTICAGQTETLQSMIHSLKAQTLGESPESAHVIVSAVCSSILQQSLGEISMPANPFVPVGLNQVKLGSTVQMIALNLWRTEPGDDKESYIELKGLVQNLTNSHLPEVKVLVSITDKAGREMREAYGAEEVRPLSISAISGGGWVKDKNLDGAKAKLSIQAFVPVAAGLAQHFGFQISADDGNNESGAHINWPSAGDAGLSRDEESDEDANSLNNGYPDIVKSTDSTKTSLKRRLYANCRWFSPAEQPDNFSSLPAEFIAAKKLWESDKDGNIEEVIGLLDKYVGSRFIASNICNWEELFVDDEGGGLLEIESSAVRVVGIDFSHSPIPLCKAEATFIVDVSESFLSENLEDWQESNGPFTDGVAFYWDIPRTDETEDLDFTVGDNSGVECIVLDTD